MLPKQGAFQTPNPSKEASLYEYIYLPRSAHDSIHPIQNNHFSGDFQSKVAVKKTFALPSIYLLEGFDDLTPPTDSSRMRSRSSTKPSIITDLRFHVFEDMEGIMCIRIGDVVARR
jgi:hypothetical protein